MVALCSSGSAVCRNLSVGRVKLLYPPTTTHACSHLLAGSLSLALPWPSTHTSPVTSYLRSKSSHRPRAQALLFILTRPQPPPSSTSVRTATVCPHVPLPTPLWLLVLHVAAETLLTSPLCCLTFCLPPPALFSYQAFFPFLVTCALSHLQTFVCSFLIVFLIALFFKTVLSLQKN